MMSVRRFALPVLLLSGQVANSATPRDFVIGMDALIAGDYAVAYCHWKPLAAKGYADAQYHIAWLYANGNGLAVDIGKALALWMEAARQGHTDAQFAIGLAYTTGEGMKKDLDEAVNWYLAAARQGHPDARDILLRLNGDPSVRLLDRHPEVAAEDWFGWRGIVTSDRINVRGGPGTDHTVVTQLALDTRLRVVGQRDEWYMVVLPETEPAEVAWIHRSLVRRLER